MGLFHCFFKDKPVEFIGVEAAGLGLHTSSYAATLNKGRAGVLHGSKVRSCRIKRDKSPLPIPLPPALTIPA